MVDSGLRIGQLACGLISWCGEEKLKGLQRLQNVYVRKKMEASMHREHAAHRLRFHGRYLDRRAKLAHLGILGIG